MLKLGKVYIYKDRHYFFIKSKRRYNRRIRYLVVKVRPNGTLGAEKEILFKRNVFKLTDIKPQIHIPLPKIDRDKIYFNGLVDRALEFSAKYTLKRKAIYRHEISKQAYAAIYFVNRETGDNYNLRDFAKAMGLVDYRKLYRWVASYMKSHFTKEKYTTALPEAADTTIVTNYRNLTKMWGSLHGYNNDLDKLLHKNVKAYAKEIKIRGLLF